ncbi:MAG: AbrB/MazE/SpoVT family DNA-binding domain-containing protein [Ideonella sp.]|nr:AbrB/MazE/SpoVT family DNA-binding domain-containing protein [Ideonella sp.]MCC7457002.1 AbrB/MazE/SpoVT family DNA-binding domain-containing protein [Nitrospira sp.]
MTETTVFQSGNSQAVRLPKEFRFKSKTVEIYRRGDEVVLREKPRTVRGLLASLPPLTEQDHAALDAMFAAIREPLPERERDWQALFGADDAKRTTSAAKAARKKTR